MVEIAAYNSLIGRRVTLVESALAAGKAAVDGGAVDELRSGLPISTGLIGRVDPGRPPPAYDSSYPSYRPPWEPAITVMHPYGCLDALNYSGLR